MWFVRGTANAEMREAAREPRRGAEVEPGPGWNGGWTFVHGLCAKGARASSTGMDRSESLVLWFRVPERTYFCTAMEIERRSLLNPGDS